MNNVAVYDMSVESADKVSNNFRVREFACADGSNVVLLDAKLAFLLQNCRDFFGKPLYISSGYRTPSFNNSLENAAQNSYHTYGMAADICMDDVKPQALAEYFETCMPNNGGIGVAETYVHIDTREQKARWTY